MHSFWTFSLALYKQTGVEAVCLRLQDQYGVNVNLLLWCVWLERRQILLTDNLLAQAFSRLNAWDRQVVKPIRAARRAMKQNQWLPAADFSLVAQCKEVELAAERVQQNWLDDMAQGEARSTQAIARGFNIQRYLSNLGVLDMASSSDIASSIDVLTQAWEQIP